MLSKRLVCADCRFALIRVDPAYPQEWQRHNDSSVRGIPKVAALGPEAQSAAYMLFYTASDGPRRS